MLDSAKSFEMREILDKANSLTRRIVQMHLAGYTHDEIAQQIGKSPSTVFNRFLCSRFVPG
jgi:DNA-directed RNA polymerase specialized sigma24 family protein